MALSETAFKRKLQPGRRWKVFEHRVIEDNYVNCVIGCDVPAATEREPRSIAVGTLFICLREVIKSFDQFYRLKFWSDQMNFDLVLRQDYLFELGYDNN